MIYFLAESLLVLFEFGTAIVGLLILYLLRRLPAYTVRISPKALGHVRWSTAFCVLIAIVTLFLTHLAIVLAGTLQAFFLLSVGLLAGLFLYFRTLAHYVEQTPIRHVLFVWITLAVFLAALLGIVSWGTWRAGHLLGQDEFVSMATVVAPLAQVTGILVAALGVVVANIFTSQQEVRSAARTNYQSLEFGAISLFRFEKDNPELVEILWFAESLPESDTPEGRQLAHHLEQYIAQYLNLFEMALRLRIEKVVPPEVFASWVPWMYEICGLPVFAEMWREELRPHYVNVFRDLMDRGVVLAATDDDSGLSTTAEQFYLAAATAANPKTPCREVLNWIADARRAAAQSLPEKPLPAA